MLTLTGNISSSNPMKENIQKSGSRGFTLLEVMVAVGILAFALVTLLGAVNRNLVLTSNARNREVAAKLADDIVTRIQIEGLPQERQSSGNFQDHPGFKWFISVDPFNLGQLNARIKILRVLITWDDGEEVYEVNLAVNEA